MDHLLASPCAKKEITKRLLQSRAMVTITGGGHEGITEAAFATVPLEDVEPKCFGQLIAVYLDKVVNAQKKRLPSSKMPTTKLPRSTVRASLCRTGRTLTSDAHDEDDEDEEGGRRGRGRRGEIG